jgi:mRNA interferase YafQ
MRKIESATAFKRDFKRESKGLNRTVLDTDLKQIITDLANDVPLAAKHRDHPLIGNLKGYRDCHIRPDLVLIYQKLDAYSLRLARLGSHAELGL